MKKSIFTFSFIVSFAVFYIFLNSLVFIASSLADETVNSAYWTFDASAQTVTVTALPDLLHVTKIINTTDDVPIYELGNPDRGGAVSSGVITLDFNTTNMSDSDGLLIAYEAVSDAPPNVRVYGKTVNADSGVLTDLASTSDAGNVVWDAPNAARVHQLVSSSASDDGAPVGVGAQTVQVCGLLLWTSAAETCETLVLNGVGNVATLAYVHINSLEVLAYGATGVNVGIIKVTADTDTSISQTMIALTGVSQSTVYGIPSTQTLYLQSFWASTTRDGKAAGVDVELLVNDTVATFLDGYIVHDMIGVAGTGLSYVNHPLHSLAIPGPALIKLRVNSDAADLIVTGGFVGYLKTN